MRELMEKGIVSLLFFALWAPAILMADEAEPAKEASLAHVARIVIQGDLADAKPQDNPFGPTKLNFKRQLDLIADAAADADIAALELQVDDAAMGLSKIQELHHALAVFKQSGKPIFGYAEQLTTADLLILAPSDFLAIPESGMVLVPGINAEVMYFKEFFEKLGIQFMVEHVGDYKSAYENFHLPSMSEAQRKVLEDLMGQIFDWMVQSVATHRDLDPSQVLKAVDQALMTPKQARDMGLVDAVCYYDQFKDHMRKHLKVDELVVDKKYGRKDKTLDMNNPFVLFSQIMAAFGGKKKKDSEQPKIALIYASGPIHSGKNTVDPMSGENTIGSDTLAAAIDEAARDDSIKAIVLRVNSPGGSGLASDIIWEAEQRARARKPLIVSMGDVAGSGGYYISMVADVIMVQPNTLTGSIGVVSAMPNLHGTMEKLGIKVERLTRGRNARLMSPFTPVEDVNLSPMTDLMEAFYWDFVDKVAAGRGMTREAVHAIAQGRVWTGKQAVENGLADELGGLMDAIELAKSRSGMTGEVDWEIKEMPEPPDFFEMLNEAMGASANHVAWFKALGLSPWQTTALNHPQIARRLARLLRIFEICSQEHLLLLMPMDVQFSM